MRASLFFLVITMSAMSVRASIERVSGRCTGRISSLGNGSDVDQLSLDGKFQSDDLERNPALFEVDVASLTMVRIGNEVRLNFIDAENEALLSSATATVFEGKT